MFLFAICFLVAVAVFYFFSKLSKKPLSPDEVLALVILSGCWPLSVPLFALVVLDWHLQSFQRYKAIRCALYYGILPWQFYEKKKHYKGSYWLHLLSNIGYALKWLFFLESKADRAFEKSVNNNG